MFFLIHVYVILSSLFNSKQVCNVVNYLVGNFVNAKDVIYLHNDVTIVSLPIFLGFDFNLNVMVCWVGLLF